MKSCIFLTLAGMLALCFSCCKAGPPPKPSEQVPFSEKKLIECARSHASSSDKCARLVKMFPEILHTGQLERLDHGNSRVHFRIDRTRRPHAGFNFWGGNIWIIVNPGGELLSLEVFENVMHVTDIDEHR